MGEHQVLVRCSTARSTTLEPQSWHMVESTSPMAAAKESQGSHSVKKIDRTSFFSPFVRHTQDFGHSVKRSIERLLFYPSFAILKISAVVKGPPLVTSKGFMRI